MTAGGFNFHDFNNLVKNAISALRIHVGVPRAFGDPSGGLGGSLIWAETKQARTWLAHRCRR